MQAGLETRQTSEQDRGKGCTQSSPQAHFSRAGSRGKMAQGYGTGVLLWSQPADLSPFIFCIIIITIIYCPYCPRVKSSHSKKQKWRGLKALCRHLSLNKSRSRSFPCSLIQRWLRTYCVLSTRLGSAQKRLQSHNKHALPKPHGWLLLTEGELEALCVIFERDEMGNHEMLWEGNHPDYIYYIITICFIYFYILYRYFYILYI